MISPSGLAGQCARLVTKDSMVATLPYFVCNHVVKVGKKSYVHPQNDLRHSGGFCHFMAPGPMVLWPWPYGPIFLFQETLGN